VRFRRQRAPAAAARTDLRIVPQPAPEPELLTARAAVFLSLVALAFGVLVRASFVFATDFPLNDGGMFAAMSADVQENGYRLPAFTTYNFGEIPFAYPPLGLCAAAMLEQTTPLSMFDVFQFLPLAVSMATMLAFAALAHRMLERRAAFVAAMFAFALIPRSFEWMIMGGGLTRSFGLLFALLALHEAHRLYRDKNPWAAVSFGVLAGLTALSHLEMAWFLAFSSLLFFVAEGRHHRTGLLGSGAAVVVAAAVSSPWWVAVLAHHGVDPFFAAMTTGSPSAANPILIFLVFRPTGETMFAIVGALSVLGILVCSSRREWLLPAWVLACGLLDPRGFGNVASAAIAMLAGIAIAEIVLPLLLRSDSSTQRIDAKRWLLPGSVLTLIVFYAMINALIATPRVLRSVPPDERAAMAWIAANTSPETEVLVLTNETWPVDRSSEWFPVLADRRSVATVQGYEWIRGAFADKLAAYRDVQACTESDANCVERWSTETNTPFDLIYMPTAVQVRNTSLNTDAECCKALRSSLRTDARYETVFENEGVTVFRRINERELRRLR
jgi:hypothetical protein